jgi:hypothetical protein
MLYDAQKALGVAVSLDSLPQHRNVYFMMATGGRNSDYDKDDFTDTDIEDEERSDDGEYDSDASESTEVIASDSLGDKDHCDANLKVADKKVNNE